MRAHQAQFVLAQDKALALVIAQEKVANFPVQGKGPAVLLAIKENVRSAQVVKELPLSVVRAVVVRVLLLERVTWKFLALVGIVKIRAQVHSLVRSTIVILDVAKAAHRSAPPATK